MCEIQRLLRYVVAYNLNRSNVSSFCFVLVRNEVEFRISIRKQ